MRNSNGMEENLKQREEWEWKDGGREGKHILTNMKGLREVGGQVERR